MSRCIPSSGINLFQGIYQLIEDYESASGRKALNLSLGNPDTVPDPEILELRGRLASDPSFDLHTYAEDQDRRGFAEAMVELHGGIRVAEFEPLRALPIPGIKTAGALMPLACGLHLKASNGTGEFRLVSHLPAYDVIGTWASDYFGSERIVWPLCSSDGMKPNLDRLRRAVAASQEERVDLVYVIRPGNPASVGTTDSEWRELIEWCLQNGSRLVNDAAYCGLATESHVPLARVARDYPNLEWIEMYSVSKSFSDPGARLGALVGSRDFVEDFNLIKGNTESGPVPSVMAAYGEFFADREAAVQSLVAKRELYRRRLEFLVPRLERAGLRPACKTDAGFFTLWKVPRTILGIDLHREAIRTGESVHELFNRRVISETGIVGVHFRGPGGEGQGQGDPLIRYAVCTDVFDLEFQERFEESLDRFRPEYED